MNRKYRKTIIAGNWKMNMKNSSVKTFIEELKVHMSKSKTCDVVICTPAVMVNTMAKAGKELKIAAGAQDVSKYESGAYTGEISAAQLSDIGAKYCIVGHSERREYHGEDDMLINAKAKALLEKVLSCIDADKDIFDPEFFGDEAQASFDEADLLAAKDCVNAFLREDFETPCRYFGKRIASYMPPDVLRYAWHEHIDPLGAFDAIEQSVCKNSSVFIPLCYEKGRAIVQFVFTGHKVSGFWLTYDAERSALQ